MVKIVRKKSLGIQPVYDIGVAQDHNFVLANGFVASNCFNKSHSTAYAYVTYQTAYLKANYPVEYMSALLTSSSDSQEKVEKYRENCLKMGIEVKPPDINLSEKEFTPQGQSILFGFSAVKNLGESAIENIIEARTEAGGRFKDFIDFMSKINLKTVNRRALETLIYAGAFDSIHNNRRQLLDNLELVINWTQKKHQEKETGQLNIFELAGNPTESNSQAEYENVPQFKEIEDFSIQEKLRTEKEYLGFYVSEHPLKPLQEAAKLLSPVNLSELSQQKSRSPICSVVMLTNIKKHIDKNNKNMAFLTIEDISGQADAIVFASTYDQVSENLLEEIPVIVWGKADNKNDKSQIIVDNITRIENTELVFISLSAQQASEPKIEGKLKSILQEQSGDKNQAIIPTIVIIEGWEQRVFIRLANRYWVQNAKNTVASLINANFFAYTQCLIPQSK
jgi:DNA polymerase-3 subunit alpha